EVFAELCSLREFLPKLSRRGADDPLKLKAKMALIRETGAEHDLGQAEPTVCPQEVLRSFNAACDHILVRRQPGGCLELPREMKGAEMEDGRHSLQRRIASEISIMYSMTLRSLWRGSTPSADAFRLRGPVI